MRAAACGCRDRLSGAAVAGMGMIGTGTAVKRPWRGDQPMTQEGSAPPGYGTAPPRPARTRRAGALAGGLGAGLAGALACGVVAYYVHHNLDLLAVLIGALTGYTVARLRPRDLITAAGSALVALASCVVGRFLVELFGLAGAGVTVSSLVSHLGLLISAYRFGVGLRLVACWAIAAGLAFWIPLRWAGRPRTPSWRR
jgi:hypothetical protein